jgi:hypothetical protein
MGILHCFVFDDCRKEFSMSKISTAEKADNVPDEEGAAIIAVFPTADGNFRYVRDMKEYEALEFTEEKLVASRR